jgi:hypothetical protein
MVKQVSNTILIIVGVVFIVLILFVLLVALFSLLGQPKCPNGYIASNQRTLKIRTDGFYLVGEEVCHDYSACNNGLARCVYNNTRGTSCPGSLDYTGKRLTTTDVCVNNVICADWTGGVGFEDAGGVSLQQTTDRLYTNTCGLQENNLSRIWPSTCIRGVLGFNESDNLWYCMEPVLNCQSDNNETLVRGVDGTFRCSNIS